MAAIVVIATAGLFVGLASFPGLHGDEAWMGLRALEQQARGMFTLKGMNDYTGSLFPEIVTAFFSMLPPGVASLRLPGALLNDLALLLGVFALWKRGPAALCFALLMGSSLLFLFYSRVAWEVNALQNLLLAMILLALTRLSEGRTHPGWIALLLLAFSIGCWNHAIFAAAALSFAAAAILMALRWPGRDVCRLLLIALLNLLLQLVFLGKYLVADGPFITHALPAIGIGSSLILIAAHVYVLAEAQLLAVVLKAVADPRVSRFANVVLIVSVLLSAAVAPMSGVSFFGTVSGVIMLERVASYMPGQMEMAALHVRMAILLAVFAATTFVAFRSTTSGREQALLPLLILWTITYFPALRLATPSVADRYYVIPQFLFFCSLALASDSRFARWRIPFGAVLLCGFIYAQAALFREAARQNDRPPLAAIRYGAYADTSWHFLRLDALTAYLGAHAICRVESSSFFISVPMRFMMATGQACASAETIQLEYCADCVSPLPWFDLKSPEKDPGRGESRH